MIGDTFKTTAILRKEGYFDLFGVCNELRTLYGVKKNEPIYEVEFEVVEEKPKYPKETKQEYWGYYEDGEYSLIQPNVICFSIQFPHPVFETQGTQKYEDCYFGIVVRLKVKNYKQI